MAVTNIQDGDDSVPSTSDILDLLDILDHTKTVNDLIDIDVEGVLERVGLEYETTKEEEQI
jgi:hypothetical protein